MARGILSTFDARARRGRRGITLLEVLISMGILAVGLLSIAALIPAGRLEIMQAVKLDYASMVGRGAFRDLQIRGYLNPTTWLNTWQIRTYFHNAVNFDLHWSGVVGSRHQWSSSIHWRILRYEPYTGFLMARDSLSSDTVSIRRLVSRRHSHNRSKTQFMTPIFRCPDDLTLTPTPRGRIIRRSSSRFRLAKPPPYNTVNPIVYDTSFGIYRPQLTAEKRASEGNYSWIATVVTDPTSSALSGAVTVSVAVIYKRDLEPPATDAESQRRPRFSTRSVTLPLLRRCQLSNVAVRPQTKPSNRASGSCWPASRELE